MQIDLQRLAQIDVETITSGHRNQADHAAGIDQVWHVAHHQQPGLSRRSQPCRQGGGWPQWLRKARGSP